MHRALLITVAVVCGALMLTGNALAKGGGGGGHGGGGGRSGSHMSDKGSANTNAQRLPGSTSGLDRAQTRMSDQGAAHQQATRGERRRSTARQKTVVPKLPLPPPLPGMPDPPAPPKLPK